jgi:hypothetical protein
MKEGEKYLGIKIVGHEIIKAFPNKEKKEGSNEPDFKGNGVGVWINKVKPKEQKKNKEEDLI